MWKKIEDNPDEIDRLFVLTGKRELPICTYTPDDVYNTNILHLSLRDRCGKIWNASTQKPTHYFLLSPPHDASLILPYQKESNAALEALEFARGLVEEFCNHEPYFAAIGKIDKAIEGLRAN